MKKNIACFFGTRPEVIKMAPLIHALKKHPEFSVTVISTAQHREMLDDMVKLFDIHVDIDLNCMMPNQTLSDLTANLLHKISPIFEEQTFDAVLIQGDTTTVMTVALACFYKNIPVGHVEAGLRTYNLRNPFPEELNRILVSKLARWHFAPTEIESQNLLAENVPAKDIFVTGNTVVDAVKMMVNKNLPLPIDVDPNKKLILVTAHRRENFGEPLRHICEAIQTIARRFPDVEIIYPVHPNPNVQAVVNEWLSQEPRVHLLKPLSYEHFIACMQHAYLIMSDSGGVQEEAPILGKPILILRDTTERPETVNCGIGQLVGTSVEKIVAAASDLLTNLALYQKTAQPASPYGDGFASEKIVKILEGEI